LHSLFLCLESSLWNKCVLAITPGRRLWRFLIYTMPGFLGGSVPISSGSFLRSLLPPGSLQEFSHCLFSWVATWVISCLQILCSLTLLSFYGISIFCTACLLGHSGRRFCTLGIFCLEFLTRFWVHSGDSLGGSGCAGFSGSCRFFCLPGGLEHLQVCLPA